MTTHYMDEAEHCDRIAIMDHGEIVVARHARRRSRPASARTACRSTPTTTRRAIAALRGALRARGRVREGAVTFAVAQRRGSSCPRLFAELGVPIRSVSVSRPSLDDVFMTYTGRRSATPRRRRRPRRQHCAMLRAALMTTTATDAARSSAVRGAASARVAPASCARVKIVWAARADPLRQRPAADRHRAASSRCCSCSCSAPACRASRRRGTGGARPPDVPLPRRPRRCRCCSPRCSRAASIVWDREFGFLREMLVAPVRRSLDRPRQVPRRRDRRHAPGRARARARRAGATCPIDPVLILERRSACCCCSPSRSPRSA